MPLDPDAKMILDALKGIVAMPGAGADVQAYRAASKARQVPREPPPITRVETLAMPGPGGEVRLRFYDDAPGGLRPTLVFYHGGGFVIGDLDSHDDLCRRLVKASGWAVLAVDYRLAPEARYPAAFDDAYAALLWAAGPGGQALGVDADRLAVGGDSAGGNLAACVALAARDRAGPALRHQLLIYPVINHAFSTASYLDADPDYFLTGDAMTWFWEQYLGPEGDRSDPLAAPGLASDLGRLPATTVVTAGYDPLRDEGEHYARRLKAAGVEVESRRYEGAFHGFVSMDMLASAKDATAWLAQRLRASATPSA